MNFTDLYKKIADIDRSTVTESAVTECGDMPPAPTSVPHQPMSMSVNINAQGEQEITSLMRLLTKVNPDMMPKVDASPVVSPELTIGGPGPKISSPADDIKGDMMKLLPLDKEEGPELDDESVEPEGEEDDIMTHLNKELKPYDDQVAKEKETEEGAYDANTTPKPEYKGIDAVVHDGDDLNKSKATFPKVNGGDNPMQKVKEELAAALAAYKAQ